jgi:hypothetical protein
MSNIPKPKRKIVPLLIAEDTKAAGNISKDPIKQSVVFKKHLEGLNEKNYINDLETRAVKLGYAKSKTGKPRVIKDKHAKHGTHHLYLNDFNQYVVHYCGLVKKNKTATILEYLKKQFDLKRYYSSTTKRFRKL